MMRRKLVAGNWKMHGLSGDLGEIASISIAAETIDADIAPGVVALSTSVARDAAGPADHSSKRARASSHCSIWKT